MSVSRKSPGTEPMEQVDENYEMTTNDYAADKQACIDRSGYESNADVAVPEKLPGGSQDY